MEKKPLNAWRGTPPTFEPNSLHESLGEVTITIPVEVAMFIVGLMGPLRCEYQLPDERILDTYYSFYVPLVDSKDGVIPRAFQDKLFPIREIGRKIGMGGVDTAANYAPKK